MRSFGVLLGAVLAAVLFAVPASAERGSWNNWHVHQGPTAVYTDSTGLTHRGPAFFPVMFTGGNVAAYTAAPSLWAYCPDATDKGLVGGDGGAKVAAGTCRNEDNIIHLQVVASGGQGPAGWSSLTSGGNTVYYLLTPR